MPSMLRPCTRWQVAVDRRTGPVRILVLTLRTSGPDLDLWNVFVHANQHTDGGLSAVRSLKTFDMAANAVRTGPRLGV